MWKYYISILFKREWVESLQENSPLYTIPAALLLFKFKMSATHSLRIASNHQTMYDKILITHALQSKLHVLRSWKTSASNSSLFSKQTVVIAPLSKGTKAPVYVKTTCRLSSCQSLLVQERCRSGTPFWVFGLLRSCGPKMVAPCLTSTWHLNIPQTDCNPP